LAEVLHGILDIHLLQEFDEVEFLGGELGEIGYQVESDISMEIQK
jgi:hypothetical protein